MVENLFESTTPGIPRGEKWPLQSENVPNFAGEPNLHLSILTFQLCIMLES